MAAFRDAGVDAGVSVPVAAEAGEAVGASEVEVAAAGARGQVLEKVPVPHTKSYWDVARRSSYSLRFFRFISNLLYFFGMSL